MLLNALKYVTTNTGPVNILIATGLSLLCWFVLPHISIAGAHPFSSELVRSAFVALIYLLTVVKLVIGWVLKYKLTSSDQIKKVYAQAKVKSGQCYNACINKSQEIYSHTQDLFRKDPGPRIFKKLPIYLVVGSERCGKKSFMEQAGLRLLPASYFGNRATQAVEDHPHFKWYFSDQGIYIICSNDYAHDIKSYSKLLKFLKKRRSHKPLSGLLFLFSMPELMLAKHDDRKHFLQGLTDQMQLIHRYLKVSIPLYCLLTKLDLVNGFTEFFNHLSKDELMQLWGVTFPLSISGNIASLDSYFQVSYDQLIGRLDNQLSQVLDIEKDEKKRQLIYGFPQQMQLFKHALQGLLNEMFAGLSHQKILQMRGVYFTSALQTGEPYDFIAHAMNAQFDFEPQNREVSIESHESYFIFNVFQSVILKECEYVGYSLKIKKYRRLFYRVLCVGIPSFVIVTGWAFHKICRDFELTNVEVNNRIDFYQQAKKDMDIHNPSAKQALVLLNPLLKSERSLQSNSLLSWIFFSNDTYLNSVSNAVDRTLTSQYIPRLATNLEMTLDHGKLDTNTLYATLKGYLAFSPQDDTPASSIVAPMKLLWQTKYAPDSPTMNQLTYYLDRSVHLNITALPIDRQLINRMRLALQQVVPSDRAYALLTIKSMASALPDVVLSSLAGQAFSTVFVLQSQQDSIPALYTSVGFNKLFEKNIKDIAKQVSQDNKAIGLKSKIDRTESLQAITKEMQIKYNAGYLNAWDGLLKHLQIKPISNYQQARQTFAVLSDSDSPFDRVIHIIRDNTSQIQADHITVSDHYNSLNAFSASSLSGSSLTKVDDAFGGIEKILTKIAQSANPAQSALDYVQAFPKKGADDPFKRLSLLAKKVPQPIQQWLQQLSHQAWNAIAKEALVALNQQWHDQVIVYYQQHLAQHYPVDLNSDRPLSIDYFTAFYKPTGIYDKFYQKYIVAYIDDSNENKFVAKTYSGYTLPFSQSEMNFFEKSDHIKKDYFSSDGKAQVIFSLKPMSLDKEASDFSLSIGEQNFGYAHGPQEVSNYQWPFDLNNSSADLTVTGFSSGSHHMSANGPWALFKIFSHAQVNKTKDGYLMEYRLGGLHLSWLCDTDVPVRALKLKDFSSLNFPITFTLRQHDDI